jgi:hypothetical protein
MAVIPQFRILVHYSPSILWIIEKYVMQTTHTLIQNTT